MSCSIFGSHPATQTTGGPSRSWSKTYSAKLFGDKGYLSQPLFETLFEQQVQLVTKLRAKMKNRLVSMFDKIMLRKRAIIESVVDQLKNISQMNPSNSVPI